MAEIASVATLAAYLIDGYWQAPGAKTGNAYPPHHFDHTHLTYSTSLLAGPTADQHRTLIREALQQWSDVCGVTFTEVAMGGELVFTNNYAGTTAGAIPNFEAPFGQPLHYVGSTIAINEGFAAQGGFLLAGNTFDTYVHEIGHALGLGHLGPYNVGVPDGYVPTYAVDRIFDNDTERFSVMSYFDESKYEGASPGGNPTPQMADILAVQSLYGPAVTRPGDTIYGRAGNAGAVIDSVGFGLPGLTPPASFTIVDSGGTDLIDVSHVDVVQRLVLTPGTWSSVGGGIKNLGIGSATTIENARTGGGADDLVGNAVDNGLDGGAGADHLWGGYGNDTLIGGPGGDRLDGGPDIDMASYAGSSAAVSVYLSGGAGLTGDAGGDTLVGIENVTGSRFNDGLVGDGNANLLDGGDGSDALVGGGGADVLIGGEGDDSADYGDGTVGVNIDLEQLIQHGGEAEGDWLIGIENVSGSQAADLLRGNPGVNRIQGGGGADSLDGRDGRDVLEGGTGNDVYRLRDASWSARDGYAFDTVVESADGGLDIVEVQAAATAGGTLRSYTLPAEVENGTITTASAFTLAGNALPNGLWGHDGADVLQGAGGDDTLKGGGGADRLEGGLHADMLQGDAGNDVLKGGGGADRLEGGLDFDLAAYDESPAAVQVDLATGRGRGADAEGDSLSGIEGLVGSTFGDALSGDINANLLRGLEGGDTLAGGFGNDTLAGGPQADLFVWSSGDGHDLIEDFGVAAGDRIDLRGAAGVRGLADVVLAAAGSGTRVTVPGGTLQLDKVVPAQLGAAQFVFSKPPSDISLSVSHVAENSAVGTLVGTLTAADPDPGERFTYALTDNAQGRFALQGDRLVVAGALDHETTSAHGVRVRVTDRAGHSYEKNLSIAVDNVVETRNGSAGSDTIAVVAGQGVDRVVAGAGNDSVTIGAGLGRVVVDAGTGNDVITGNGQTVLSFASATAPVSFNLASGAGARQALLKNLDTGAVTPLQTRSGARDAQDFGSSDNPVFSSDGSRVAFQSTAQLDPAQPGGSWQVWVKDLASGATTLVSSTATGVAGLGNSLATDYRVAWSPDGARIAFTSSATNLVAGDSNNLADLFVKTLSGPQAGRIERASLAGTGAQAVDASAANSALPHGSYGPQFSPDGRLLLYWSSADNLVAGDHNGQSDVFLRVLSGAGAGSTFLVSRSSGGGAGNGPSLDASFSPDGSKVVFRSTAADLGASGHSLFVKDVSAAYSGTDPAAGALVKVAAQGFGPSFSPDGRQLLFHNGQILSVDLATLTTKVVSSSAAGTPANSVSQTAAWSRDGQSVVFASTATNLVPGDSNGAIDVFVKTLAGANAGAIVRASTDASGVGGNANSLFPLLSPANGRLVAFETDANNLVVPGSGVGVDKFSGVNGVWGSPFNDVLVNSNASLATASYRGGAGSDVIQGHTATRDEADYRDSSAAIVLTMGNDPLLPGYGSARDGWGGTDTLRSIDDVQGSAFGDTIRMDGLVNHLYGHGGDDRLEGRGGNDLLDGGVGLDTVVLSGRRADYVVTAGGSLLGEATQWQLRDARAGSPDGTDGLIDVERVQFADVTLDVAHLLDPLAVGLVGVVAGGA